MTMTIARLSMVLLESPLIYNAKTRALNTGGFSIQLAWARIARRYQSSPQTDRRGTP